jgi:heat shock transcription factor
MMNFLARAMQNPNFVQQLAQMDRKKQVEEAITKKRRRSIAGPSSVEGDNFVKVERQKYGDIYELDVSELDKFAMDMLETDENRKVHGGKECKDKEEEHESRGKDLCEGFWKELLNDVFDEEVEVLDVQEEDEEDVNVLIEQIGCLVSRPK